MAETRSAANPKNILWMMSGICAAAVGLLIWSPYKKRIVADLANRLHTPEESPAADD